MPRQVESIIRGKIEASIERIDTIGTIQYPIKVADPQTGEAYKVASETTLVSINTKIDYIKTDTYNIWSRLGETNSKLDSVNTKLDQLNNIASDTEEIKIKLQNLSYYDLGGGSYALLVRLDDYSRTVIVDHGNVTVTNAVKLADSLGNTINPATKDLQEEISGKLDTSNSRLTDIYSVVNGHTNYLQELPNISTYTSQTKDYLSEINVQVQQLSFRDYGTYNALYTHVAGGTLDVYIRGGTADITTGRIVSAYKDDIVVDPNSNALATLNFSVDTDRIFIVNVRAIAVNGSKFDLEIFEKSTAEDIYRVLKFEDAEGSLNVLLPGRGIPYLNEDGNYSIYVRIWNKGTSQDTFKVLIRGVLAS